MFIRKYALLLLFIIAPIAHAQTWITVATESTSTNITFPAGTTYRWGNVADNKYSAPITFTSATTIEAYCPEVANCIDPDVNQPKVIQVLETTVAQTVTVTIAGANPLGVNIPAAAPITVSGSLPSSTIFPVTLNGVTYQCTNISLSSNGTLTITCN
jgi:hypothetical protein